jgi:hypothetical protein
MSKPGLYWDRGRIDELAKFTIVDKDQMGYQFGFNGDCGGPRKTGSWYVEATRNVGNILLPYSLWVWG